MSEGNESAAPPPLPPRKASPAPLSAPISTAAATAQPAGSSKGFGPPPLPPRFAPVTSAALVIQERTQDVETPRVNITPASPASPVSSAGITVTGFGQGGEHVRTAPLQAVDYEATVPAPMPATAPPVKVNFDDSQIPLTATNPAGVIAKTQSSPGSADIPVTAVLSQVSLVDMIIIGALALNLLVGRLSVIWAAVIAGGLYLYKAHAGDVKSPTPPFEEHVRPGEGREAVEWVNHALYALFPLISTDVLTPCIDLLEDALIQQVPPIVTSVRLTSAALGAQPMLLTSMRPLSDQEWFASLAIPGAKSQHHDRTGIKADGMSKNRHDRTPSVASKLSRTTSSSSVRSIDPEVAAQEAVRRRKRDRILQRVTRHKGQNGNASDLHSMPDFVHRTGEDAEAEAQIPDGERHRGGPNIEMDQNDPDVGQYVNYQVGFEYHRTESSKKKGYGLHMLAYFGWGLKGVAKSEIPVYIDVLHIKGKMNVRLLLSANPPFARTASFSFTSLPEFDISAKPLKQGSFNAMELPGMKSYVQKSIAEVAKAFVRPESYSIDIDRLLLGRESALRTNAVGVLHIIIHSAEDLPKTDTMGSCDPYLMICFTKFRKPVFSTRTIIDTTNPQWEEEAFVMVYADTIESGERLRMRLLDSDRFSADDSLGVVEVDISELVEQAENFTRDQPPLRRIDRLTAERPGMKTSGQLEWSVRFCPLWSMPQEELERRVQERAKIRAGEPKASDMKLPAWLSWIENYMDTPDFEAERAQRRKDTLAWFTGDRGREEIEAASPPTDDLRSGILQFHIHQCVDLEVDSLQGTYSSANNPRLSSAGGKPALAEEIDRTSTENPDPPSAYCEVHLNDRLVFRTRTKQVTPLPYFNASSERFLRDWRMAKIVFVVRDERDREHDPILGLVSLHLRDVLKEQSHFTRWFPLSTGLGWGRIRISLLFKPIDIHLPPRVSGYEVATLDIRKFEATDLSRMTEKNISVMLETESDRYILETAGDEAGKSTASLESMEGPGTPRSIGSMTDATQVAWDIDKPIRLAIEYRHSSSIVISFITRSKVVKKKKILGIAVLRLHKSADGELSSYTLPVFETSEVKDAIKGTTDWFNGTYSRGDTSPGERRKSTSSRRSSGLGARIIGYVSIDFVVYPGISRAHRKLKRKDLRFARVYEAWESYRDVLDRRARTRENKMIWSESMGMVDGAEGEGDEGDSNDDDDDDDGSSEDDNDDDELRKSGYERGLVEEPPKEGFMAERRAHSKALHKKHKGIFQMKIVRTGQLVKDKIEAKIRSSNQERRRGADLDVEHEGQSSL